MLFSTLKPCCNQCSCVDIEVSKLQTISYETHVDIKCSHEKVCKYFADCDDLYAVEVIHHVDT